MFTTIETKTETTPKSTKREIWRQYVDIFMQSKIGNNPTYPRLYRDPIQESKDCAIFADRMLAAEENRFEEDTNKK